MNAIQIKKEFEQITTEDFNESFMVNVIAPAILTKELNIGKLFEKIGRKALETKLTIISNMLLWKFQYVSQLPPTRVPGRYLAAFFLPYYTRFLV